MPHTASVALGAFGSTRPWADAKSAHSTRVKSVGIVESAGDPNAGGPYFSAAAPSACFIAVSQITTEP